MSDMRLAHGVDTGAVEGSMDGTGAGDEADFLRRLAHVPERALEALPDEDAGWLEDRESGRRYQVDKVLGRGGQGEVSLCKDTRIARDVAMKTLTKARAGDLAARQRFLREVRVQGQLQHPSIVPVYDLGVNADGDLCFTMKCLSGLTLSEILEGHRTGDQQTIHTFSRRKLLTAFSSVCLAVDFAHARGVIHRDLKPANLMLGDFGEVYVLDWGIAKVRGAKDEPEVEVTVPDDLQTTEGNVLGTYGYMSPEQARGDVQGLDARSDVYALGAILFEILTLERLHPRTSLDLMVRSTVDGVEERVSTVAAEHGVAPELAAICVEATSLDPADRHASARALHDALERFLEGARDVEIREKLASRHARTAAEIAERATGSFDARSDALREVGRALALNPENADALRTLVQVVTTPPREEPDEVKHNLEASMLARARAHARDAVVPDLVGVSLSVPFALWTGVRDWRLVGAMMAFTALAVLFKVAMSRARHFGQAKLLMYVAFASNLAAILCISRAFGPFVVVPVLLAAFMISLSNLPQPGHRLLVAAMGCVTLLLPIGLEALGLWQRSYAFHDGAMVILPNGLTLSETTSMVGLTVASLYLMVGGSWHMGRMAIALHDAQRRSELTLWHLNQLVPRDAQISAS